LADTSFNWGSFFSSPEFWTSLWKEIDRSKNPDGVKMIKTPEEQAVYDKKMKLLDNSPYRDFGSGYIGQTLQGISGFKPDFQFTSDAFKGQKPMMGFSMPNIDFSSLPQPWQKAASPTSNAAGPSNMVGSGGGQVGLNGRGADVKEAVGLPVDSSRADGPMVGESIYDFITRSNASPGDVGSWFPADQRPPAATQPPPTPEPNPLGWNPDGVNLGTNESLNGIFQKAADWATQHPSLVKGVLSGGAGALATVLSIPAIASGPIGTIVYNWFTSRYGSKKGGH
jgi:hypothetical protein